MTIAPAKPATLEAAASRLADLLTGRGSTVVDADPEASSRLEFEPIVEPRPLERTQAPHDVWAVDGGQALVVDARCLQLYVTRAARVCFVGNRCVMEDEGEVRHHLLPDGATDVNLLRDSAEWDAVERCVNEAEPGALVLVDGDLQPDWRIPSTFLGGLLHRARDRKVTLASVTKHSSLARGGAPLLGQLEREAQASLGPRALWWAPVAVTKADLRPDLGGGLQVVAARLDPDARFSFRIDLPAGVDPEPALGALSALSDDAGFPGYPYPLTVADRLAACPLWLRDEVRFDLDDRLDALGVHPEVRERAFADRHRLMERY